MKWQNHNMALPTLAEKNKNKRDSTRAHVKILK